ncbi:MAG: DUF3987 domain-containing protein [Beijerinckiaceae bacterium]|jgi:putative DNA primase/helicase
MDDASDKFAALSEDEFTAGSQTGPYAPRVREAPPTCPPPDAQYGTDAAARLYGREPDASWRYATAQDETAFFAARWNETEGKKQFRPVSWIEGQGWRFCAWPDHRPLYRLPDLAENPKAPVVVCEGEKAADAAAAIFPQSIATTSSGGAGAAAKTDWVPLAGRRVLVWPDFDAPGAKYAEQVAKILAALDCTVSIINAEALAAINPGGGAREPAENWDSADAAEEWSDCRALRKAAFDCAKAFVPAPAPSTIKEAATKWPEPKPLPKGLLPVAPFDYAFLPVAISNWARDISERMQCPPDFVGVAAMVALGSVIGRKIAVRPQRKTDWFEVPNLWACIIGRPGAMKSPAMSEALKPLNRLDAQAREENEAAARAFAVEAEVHKLVKEDAAKKVRAALKDGVKGACALLTLEEPEEPKARRFLVNDCSYEALGAIMADNPNGVLAFRDELVSLLKTLDREDNAAARGFFLTAWNGTGGYTFDRIIRGRTHIEAACLSLLGSTQPGRIAEYIRRASGGASDDGLIQRFGLLVWPDQSPEWRNVDRFPDSNARTVAFETFKRLDTLDPDTIACERDPFEPLPFLRFDNAAQGLFEEWRAGLESRLRSNDLSPALESHLSKYRKLVPGLALISHIAEGGGAIGETALLRALAFAEYLETHARRAYGAANEAETASAIAILSRIQRGELADGFTARDIYRRAWAHLSDREQVQAGLDLLADFDWLELRLTPTNGRTRAAYAINPKGARP